MMLWEPEEDSLACTLRHQGLRLDEIGRRLGRSKDAVKNRLERLGMPQKRVRKSKAKEGTYGAEPTRRQYLKELTNAEAEWTRLMEGRSFANIR